MKIAKKTKSTRKIALIAAVIILFGAAGIASALYLNNRQTSTTTGQGSSQVTQLDNQSEKPSKGQTANQDAKDKQDFLDSQKDSSTPTTKPDLADDTVSLSVSSDAKSLVVKTQLKNFSGAGSCSLTLRKGPVEVSEKADIIYQPEFSICAGFSVDRSKLSNGVWSIQLTVESDGKTVQKSTEYNL